MQCSCCRGESENLREYSYSGSDPRGRKTIVTLQLCTICRILYRIKPQAIRVRTAPVVPRLARRVA